MPNIIDATGLTTQTQAELVTYFTAQYQAIYGADITLTSDSPDGQMMNIFIQAILDLEDLLTTIYNSFDPDTAVGTQLDQRCAINGVQRQAGTFTITPVTVVTSQSVNLYGLDQTAQPVFTVSDNAGNLWELQTTVLGTGVGTFVYNFQAAVVGAQLTTPNTITVPVTIILGVTSINNPTTYTTLGINTETDAVLRLRRQQSVSLASQGYLAGLLAALENINGVSAAFVYENTSSSTNGDGVPGHSIWVIVGGSGATADIAQAIYTKRNAGAGMFGLQSYAVTQVDGSLFTVLWDDVAAQKLFIAFTATSINGINPPNIAGIQSGLVTDFIPGINQEVNINALATIVQEIDSNTLVTSAGFSAGITQIATLSGIAASGSFRVAYAGNESASINWNDAIGTIQTKVQAISGLSAALVTGSIASETLTFNLASIGNVLELLYVKSNTLQTSGPVAITFSFSEGYTNTLSPLTKKNQFVTSSINIVILPMLLSPASATAVHSGSTIAFAGLGGYKPTSSLGAYTFSLSVNASGGSIDSTTGVYHPGATPGSDTVKVVDVFGNSATAVVIVT